MDDPKKEKPQPRPPGWRPDIIVVSVNQPLPPPPGIKWWLQRIMDRK
jgi:hypothetical protein